MKTTTIRFGDDLWVLLESEAERSGVSVSHYVREAALARAAFTAGARAEAPADLLARWVKSTVGSELPVSSSDDAALVIAALTHTLAKEEGVAAAAPRRDGA